MCFNDKVDRQTSPDQLCDGRPVSTRQVSPEDRSALWALLTFYGGACQLSLNKKCTHLVVPEPKGVSASCACPLCCLSCPGVASVFGCFYINHSIPPVPAG